METVWREVLRCRDRLTSLATTVVQPLVERLATSDKQVQELNEKIADLASRLSASETKISEVVDELQKHKEDLASRLSASETKISEVVNELQQHKGDLASRLSASETKISELVDELQKHKGEQQRGLKQLTADQDCLRKKQCEGDGFTYSGGMCYYISTELKTWEESRQWCLDRNSDLVTIKSKEKQEWVASFNKRIHLGLTDNVTEGSFKWVDGTALTTPMFWMPGEPDREENDPARHLYPNAEENCVEYYDGSLPGITDRGWNDILCSIGVTNYICERSLC